MGRHHFVLDYLPGAGLGGPAPGFAIQVGILASLYWTVSVAVDELTLLVALVTQT